MEETKKGFLFAKDSGKASRRQACVLLHICRTRSFVELGDAHSEKQQPWLRWKERLRKTGERTGLLWPGFAQVTGQMIVRQHLFCCCKRASASKRRNRGACKRTCSANAGSNLHAANAPVRETCDKALFFSRLSVQHAWLDQSRHAGVGLLRKSQFARAFIEACLAQGFCSTQSV